MVLLQRTDKMKVGTEQEAMRLIEQIRLDPDGEGYEVKKSSYTKKTKKSQGEIIAEWYVVEVTKVFNDEQPVED